MPAGKIPLVTCSVGQCLKITDVWPSSFYYICYNAFISLITTNLIHILLIKWWFKEKNPSLQETLFQLIFLSNFEVEKFDSVMSPANFKFFLQMNTYIAITLIEENPGPLISAYAYLQMIILTRSLENRHFKTLMMLKTDL